MDMKVKKPRKESSIFDQSEDSRKKSEVLLMPSQIEIMHQIYKDMDYYKDFVLQRSKFVMKLRTHDEVVDFIQQDAVKTVGPKTKLITLD